MPRPQSIDHPHPVQVVMTDRGLRHHEVATAIGVNRAVLSQVLNRHRRSYPKLRRALAEYLDLPESDLFPDEAAA